MRHGTMKVAEIVPLEFWQDPVEDVILVFSERQCSVYCACWSAAGEPADFVGHLEFEDASDVRCSRRDYPPYQIQNDTDECSYILKVSDSDFVREYITRRNLRLPEAPLRFSDRHHFVVMGHDVYHEIVAASFTATTIPKSELKDPILRALIE
jgi:hypothetical protein